MPPGRGLSQLVLVSAGRIAGAGGSAGADSGCASAFRLGCATVAAGCEAFEARSGVGAVAGGAEADSGWADAGGLAGTTLAAGSWALGVDSGAFIGAR